MTAGRRAVLTAGVLVGLLGLARPAAAVTDEEVFRTFRFNFANPGGRAGAMGGAFVGIADDATAAAANPAGLTNLLSPEFFLELRLDDTEPTALSSFVRDPRGGAGVVRTESLGEPDSILYPSFISWVKPMKKWVLAFSRQELLHVDMTAQNRFTDPEEPGQPIVQADSDLEALVESYSVSAAKQFGKKFAAGATLSWNRLDVTSSSSNFFDFPGGATGVEADYATVIEDSDAAFGFSLGLLWEPITKLSIGAVYRDGAEFELEETIVDTSLDDGRFESAETLADFLGNRNFEFDDDAFAFMNRFEVPDQYGLGLGIKPTESLTIAIDGIVVEYSDLGKGFVGNVNALTFPGDFDCPNDGPCTDFATPVARYLFDDEVIVRLGLEYIWTIDEKWPFALRGGVWNDPNVRLSGDFGPNGVFIADNTTFPEGDDELHYTVGFGFLLQEKFQADFAADFSQLANSYTASFIYHF